MKRARRSAVRDWPTAPGLSRIGSSAGREERERRVERVRVRVNVRDNPVAHYLNLRLILRDVPR
jgi:hypothetical protein